MDDPASRLDQAMEERRLDLELEWNDVAAAAGISPANLRNIRKGKTQPKPLTIRRIERVFKWETGSFAALQKGDEPTPTDEPTAVADRPDESLTTAELIAKAEELMAEANEYLRRARGESG